MAISILMSPILFGAMALPAFAKKSTPSWPSRDFLPPVASINPKLEDTKPDENTLEPVALSAVSSPVIHTTPKVDRLATDLSQQFKSEQLQNVMDIQQKVDEADLERLWQATVEKNPVIRFSLEKLATPADLQTKQSSRFLSKTLSVLISGASMGATMLPGGGAYRNMGTMAVGNALQNMVTGKTQPTPGSLSPTEQIQMAGLIDELKMKLIHNYQDYKNTLQALAQSHEVTMKNNNLYSKALFSKNDLAIMAAGTAYYQSLMNETTLRQKAKLYRLELERLAGVDAVSTLELAVHVPTSNGSAADTPQQQQTASTETPIGPAAPAASAATQATTSGPALIGPNELPPALEISPTLGTETSSLIGPPLPSGKAKQAAKASRNKSLAKTNDSTPMPIPDKILEHKEGSR